jgi:hypothetical protein
MKNKFVLIALITIFVTIGLVCSGFSYYNISKQNQVDTADKLFIEFVKAKKDTNEKRIKSLSCPVFPNLPTDYNEKVFENYYAALSKLDFSNTTYIQKQDNIKYFEVKNVILDGKAVTIKLEFTEINQSNNFLNKDLYCIVYGGYSLKVLE